MTAIPGGYLGAFEPVEVMTDYAVGVIGAGGRGRLHARRFARIDSCTVLACADLELSRAEQLAADVDLPEDAVFTDYREMLEEINIDVLCVPTPPAVRAAIVIDCARRADLDAIHCEKPMASTWGDCRRMTQECRRRGIQLTFTHQLRYSNAVEEASAVVDNGVLGELTRVEMRRSNLLEAGIHQVDLCSHFTGNVPASWVIGQVDYREQETYRGTNIEGQTLGHWQYDNGIHGLAATGRGSDLVEPHVRLIGEEGTLDVQFSHDDFDGTRVLLRTGGEETVVFQGERGPAITRTLEDVLCCIGSDEEPRVVANNVFVANELIFGVYESSRRHGGVEFPLTVDDDPLQSMIETGEIYVE